jgi:hypothetical protein
LVAKPTVRVDAAAEFIHDLPVALPRARLSGRNSMEERRKHPRSEINEPAYVSSGGSVMTCTIRNISLEGAAIDVQNPAFVPSRFLLVMAHDSSVRDCRIAWIQGNRIGVTFAAPQQASQQAKMQEEA